MTETLASEGIMIMLIGITFVMSFLCILVFAMGIMSKIIGCLNKIFPEITTETGNKTKKSTANSNNEEIAVALAMAKAQG